MVQVGYWEVIFSYGVGMVLTIRLMDGVKHNISLQKVMYTSKITHNLVFMAQVLKNGFWVLIDDDHCSVRLGQMVVEQILSGKVKMCGLETCEELYEEITRVRPSQLHLTNTDVLRLWHHRLGKMSREVLQKSTQNMRGVEINNWTGVEE